MKIERKKGRGSLPAGIFVVAVATIGMLLFLGGYSESVHLLVLEKEMEQLEGDSRYVTQTVKEVFEQCVAELELLEENLESDQQKTKEEYVEKLKSFQLFSDFDMVGIMGTNGEGINNNGEFSITINKEMCKEFGEGDAYISDILMSGNKETGQILIAVPIFREKEGVGAVWGQYPVSAIASKVEGNNKSERYFQIIDDKGSYISQSSNEHAFAKELPLWEELQRYEFPNGETVDEIRKTVEDGESGRFYFQYNECGRYVFYEPLGINNWYVFSVVIADSVDEYVSKIRGYLLFLTICFSAFLIAIFLFILKNHYESRKIIEEKNRELSIRSSLLWEILRRVKVIPFEVSAKERQMKIYRTYGNENVNTMEFLQDFSAEALLEKGWIRKEGYESYKKLYESIIRGQMAEPIILETNFEGVWEWKKIRLIQENGGVLVGLMEDYTEQEKQKQEMKAAIDKTKLDGLTGLYNRSGFAGKIEQCLKEKSAGKKMEALFLLDLDYFKQINDTFGHQTGDRVLCDVAEKLRLSLRSNDLIGRLGGDEFIVFVRGADNEDGFRRCAEKLNSVLMKKYEENGKEVSISASIGIAVAEQGTDFNELYKRADIALYEVKRCGRNGYRLAE
ncbi:MAG: diguanylate cyclase domain-containing protein [Eisenbergiella sp.]